MKRLSRLSFAFMAASILLALSSCPSGSTQEPKWDHVVVVWEENKDFSEVANLPFIGQLRAAGLTYTALRAVARPSQPNYIAFFAGSALGVADNLDHDLSGPTLHSILAGAGLSMRSYAEGLPSDGCRLSASGRYVRKHNPAASFPSVPDADITSFANFPSDYSRLPALSFVIPDLDHDMHDGTIQEGDDWLRANLASYAEWAAGHRSLLILTFDEPSAASSLDTPILTVLVGAGIGAGTADGRRLDLVDLSDQVLASFGLKTWR